MFPAPDSRAQTKSDRGSAPGLSPFAGLRTPASPLQPETENRCSRSCETWSGDIGCRLRHGNRRDVVLVIPILSEIGTEGSQSEIFKEDASKQPRAKLQRHHGEP